MWRKGWDYQQMAQQGDGLQLISPDASRIVFMEFSPREGRIRFYEEGKA